jgi:hypothetical protein
MRVLGLGVSAAIEVAADAWYLAGGREKLGAALSQQLDLCLGVSGLGHGCLRACQMGKSHVCSALQLRQSPPRHPLFESENSATYPKQGEGVAAARAEIPMVCARAAPPELRERQGSFVSGLGGFGFRAGSFVDRPAPTSLRKPVLPWRSTKHQTWLAKVRRRKTQWFSRLAKLPARQRSFRRRSRSFQRGREASAAAPEALGAGKEASGPGT